MPSAKQGSSSYKASSSLDRSLPAMMLYPWGCLSVQHQERHWNKGNCDVESLSPRILDRYRLCYQRYQHTPGQEERLIHIGRGEGKRGKASENGKMPPRFLPATPTPARLHFTSSRTGHLAASLHMPQTGGTAFLIHGKVTLPPP